MTKTLKQFPEPAPLRDTATMAAELTPEGLRVEFTASSGAVVRLRLNSYVEALQLVRNLLDATCRRWPSESASLNGGGQ